MPLEDILNKIRDGAEKAVKEIMEDAESRAERRLNASRAEAQGRAADILNVAESEAAKIEAAAKTRADARRKQAILREKQLLVEGVFAKALGDLASLPPAEYRELILESLARAANGNETVVFGPEDNERLGPSFDEELNGRLSSLGKAAEVKVEFAPKSLGGGYILQSGGVSLNSTFPALVKRFQDELEIEVARTLFADGA
jgi:vacuolar-type H+-ATPase subunit E/Vma4